MTRLFKSASRSQQGILLCCGAYACFSLQDAGMKLLVADYTVTETLFWRSLAVLLVCLLLGRRALVHEAIKSPARKPLVLRGLVGIAAWILYYLAAREMSLAQMTTLYFSAPVIVIVLAVLILRERPTLLQWLVVALGFLGVLIACQPTRIIDPVPVIFALVSAALWAYTYIMLRQLGGQSSVAGQVAVSNFVFVLATGVTLPWTLTTSEAIAILFMACVGLIGGIAQYLLFASFAKASATVLAPFEYTGLIWAFILSYVVWDASPNLPLLLGAGLIAFSGILGVVADRRANQASSSQVDSIR
ncbi:DMT family transporter [Pectobacterium actinidiae]|uniref:DMT family transporter n=1 Tax=Pectobacterium actinidiae TaxID=1507808 RepID=UPI00382B5203